LDEDMQESKSYSNLFKFPKTMLDNLLLYLLKQLIAIIISIGCNHGW